MIANGIFIEDGYVINRYKKCIHCKACEVVNMEDGQSNLFENQFGTIMCKDEMACHRNLQEENSFIEVGVSDNDISLTDKYGNEILLSEDKRQPQFTDDFKGYFGDNNDDEGDEYDI